MKLKDLYIDKNQKIIHDNVSLPGSTKKLNYKDFIAKGDFYCHSTLLTSLEGAPKRVEGSFGCDHTSIASLVGGPEYVGVNFNCSVTGITSLEGAPSYVGKDFICYATKMTSLHDIHKNVKHIGRECYLSGTIRSHILGVMFIKGLKKIEFLSAAVFEQKEAERIINKHLKGDRNVHACQEELIDAGLSEYAKL